VQCSKSSSISAESVIERESKLRCCFGSRRQRREMSGDVKFRERRRGIYRRGFYQGIIHIDNFARPITAYLDSSVFANLINECSRNRESGFIQSWYWQEQCRAACNCSDSHFSEVQITVSFVRKGAIDVHGQCSLRGFVICKAGSFMPSTA